VPLSRITASDVLVFDLGGVLFDFQGAALIARHSRRPLLPEAVRQSWVPLVRSFETGACSEREFAQMAVETYALSLDPTSFLIAFREAAVGFYEGALALVSALGRRYRVVSLSNTNEVQWPAVLAELAGSDPFHAHHPSHLSGFHKPDPRAYQAVLREYAPDARFYFFDDRAENVATARALGWRAREVRGVAEARVACTEFGLLPSIP